MIKSVEKKLLLELQPTMEWIVFDDDPKLRLKSENVLDINEIDYGYISKMKSYIDASYINEYEKYQIRPGIAIAAPQVGYHKRIIYINFDDGDMHHQLMLVNPRITKVSAELGFINNGEGCLSVPEDRSGIIPRHFGVEVVGYDLLEQKMVKIQAFGLLSVCLQHEIDHLNGILYTDLIKDENQNLEDKKWIQIG